MSALSLNAFKGRLDGQAIFIMDYTVIGEPEEPELWWVGDVKYPGRNSKFLPLQNTETSPQESTYLIGFYSDHNPPAFSISSRDGRAELARIYPPMVTRRATTLVALPLS